jgi:predicted ester cyclase
VVGLIDFMHTEAFAAKPEITTLAVDGERAMIEAVFVGAHIGVFAGIPPTGRAVRVPYTVVYDLAGDAISALRMYFSLDGLVRQIGAA